MSKIEQDTILYLFDKNNKNRLSEDDNSGENNKYSKIEWCCPETGFYYVCCEYIRTTKRERKFNDENLIPLSPYVPVDTGEYVIEVMPSAGNFCIVLAATAGHKECIYLDVFPGPKKCIFLNPNTGPKCCIFLNPKNPISIFSIEKC